MRATWPPSRIPSPRKRTRRRWQPTSSRPQDLRPPLRFPPRPPDDTLPPLALRGRQGVRATWPLKTGAGRNEDGREDPGGRPAGRPHSFGCQGGFPHGLRGNSNARRIRNVLSRRPCLQARVRPRRRCATKSLVAGRPAAALSFGCQGSFPHILQRSLAASRAKKKNDQMMMIYIGGGARGRGAARYHPCRGHVVRRRQRQRRRRNEERREYTVRLDPCHPPLLFQGPVLGG